MSTYTATMHRLKQIFTKRLNPTSSRRRYHLFNQWIFLGPTLIVFIPIIVIPFIITIYSSMVRWDGVSSIITFVGFKNFIYIFKHDPEYGKAFLFSTKSVLAITSLANLLGLTFALLLYYTPRHLQEVGRTLLLLPNIISGVILGFIWKFIFNKGFPALSKQLGWEWLGISWLGRPTSAFWAIVIVSVWQWMGYTMIIYIAGLNNIPQDVREAAEIDGVSSISGFMYITLPLLMPSITISMFWVMVRSFTMFDLPFTLTTGGPYRSTETISMNLYEEAFAQNNYGLGSAKAMIFFIAILLIALAQVRMTKSRELEL